MKYKLQIHKREISFLIFMFTVFTILAVIIPYNNAPDEEARYLLSKFMYNHGTLPVGTNPEVRIPLWGSSYAFSPFFAYMIGSLFMKCMSFFSTSPQNLLIAARMSSVITSTIYVILVMKIGTELFKERGKWIFIVLSCCLPCFIFVSSYVNCDSLALLSTSIIIYAWIIGIKKQWNLQSCVCLIIGLSLCVLSYKNAYGYILISLVLFFYELIKAKQRNQINSMLKKGIFIFMAVLVLGGWFYIRNYVIYNGDFMASKVSYQLGETYGIEALKPSLKMTPFKSGVNIFYMLTNMEWIKISYKSFIGVFGYMNLPLPNLYYIGYTFIFGTGIVGLILYTIKNKFKKCTIFHILMLLSLIIPIALSIYYSYFEDFQPQGRYSLPMLIPLMYFVTKGCVYLSKHIDKGKAIILKKIFIYIMIFSVLYMVVNIFGFTYLA